MAAEVGDIIIITIITIPAQISITITIPAQISITITTPAQISITVTTPAGGTMADITMLAEDIMRNGSILERGIMGVGLGVIVGMAAEMEVEVEAGMGEEEVMVVGGRKVVALGPRIG